MHKLRSFAASLGKTTDNGQALGPIFFSAAAIMGINFLMASLGKKTNNDQALGPI